MSQPFPPNEFLNLRHRYPIVDARSPCEYAQGHIPESVNVPLFTDDERSQVGTCYQQKGREEAVRLGLSFVGPKMVAFVDQAQELAREKHLLLYCARGGMRSSSLAWLWKLAGLRVTTLQGGYKAFRQWVLETLAKPRPLRILGGKTGSGKTAVLQEIPTLGEQVIDLEALAHHRGSVFGGLGQLPQPTQQQFENELALHLSERDDSRPIWLESESRRIGLMQIPQPFWDQMLVAPGVLLEIPPQRRLDHLLQEYGHFTPEQLTTSVGYIAKRLGGDRHQQLVNLIQDGNLSEAVQIMMHYYDKTYLRGMKEQYKRTNQWLMVQAQPEDTWKQIAERVITAANQSELHRSTLPLPTLTEQDLAASRQT